MKHIMKCPSCNRYTLKESCSICNIDTIVPKPTKFSVEDRMGKYRRMAKQEEREKRGLI